LNKQLSPTVPYNQNARGRYFEPLKLYWLSGTPSNAHRHPQSHPGTTPPPHITAIYRSKSWDARVQICKYPHDAGRDGTGAGSVNLPEVTKEYSSRCLGGAFHLVRYAFPRSSATTTNTPTPDFSNGDKYGTRDHVPLRRQPFFCAWWASSRAGMPPSSLSA